MSYDVSPVDVSSSSSSEAGTPRRRLRAVVITLVLVLTLALFVMAFFGIVERETYEFARRYGTPVEVSSLESCVVVTNMRRGAVWRDCSATWRVEGTQVTGKLLAGADDSLTAPFDAFAVGSTALTDGYYATGASNPQLGLVPAWLFIPFPITVVTLIVIYGKRIRRWAGEDG